VQVDPIKPTLKAPGYTRLKLIYDEPLSSFALKLNWRRYIKADLIGLSDPYCILSTGGGSSYRTGTRRLTLNPKWDAEVGRQVDPIEPTLNAPGTNRLKLKYEKRLQIFAFNVILSRYTEDATARHGLPCIVRHVIVIQRALNTR